MRYSIVTARASEQNGFFSIFVALELFNIIPLGFYLCRLFGQQNAAAAVVVVIVVVVGVCRCIIIINALNVLRTIEPNRYFLLMMSIAACVCVFLFVGSSIHTYISCCAHCIFIFFYMRVSVCVYFCV